MYFEGLFSNNNKNNKDTGGMFNWTLFDNSKVIMFDNLKVSFLRKKILPIQPNT